MTIQAVQLDFGLKPAPASFYPGNPPMLRLGWIQFAYGEFAGPLQPINWQQSIFFPEYPGATGLYVWVPSWASWTSQVIQNPGQGLSIATIAGLINIASGVVTGITNGNQVQSNDLPGFTTNTPQIPIVGGTGLAVLQSTALEIGVAAPDFSILPMNAWLSMLALASELAQWCCYRNAALTTETFPSKTNSFLAVPTSGVPTYAKVNIATPPAVPDFNFGSTGIKMLGWHAWDYNGYKTPAQFINSQNFTSYPQAPTATGWYMMLKPDLEANITLGENTYAMIGLETGLGEINMLAGNLTGLLNPSNPDE